jgi:hypothetical protein
VLYQAPAGFYQPLHCATNSIGALSLNALWWDLVAVLSPALELVTHAGERKEYLDVQAFVARPSGK